MPQSCDEVFQQSLDALPNLSRIVDNVNHGRPADSFNYMESLQDVKVQIGLVFVASIAAMYCIHPNCLVDAETREMRGTMVFAIAAFLACAVALGIFCYRKRQPI